MKALLIILSFAVVYSLSAATSNTGKTEKTTTETEETTQPAKKTQDKDVKPAKFDVHAYGAEVNDKMDQLLAKLKTRKLESIEMLAYSKTFERFSKHPEIEKATKIYRQFFEKTARDLRRMSGCKSRMESYEVFNMEKDPKYLEEKKLYDPAIKNFIEFFKDPPRVKK